MRVIVAASIPLVIVLSDGGAALLGAWCASHSQRRLPDGSLRRVLGTCPAAVGVLYVPGYFGRPPIRI